jgi:hypothetical protein
MPGHFGDMPAPDFFAQVKKHFRYLFDEYGFSVVSEEITNHMDVCEILLQSKEWRIRIGREIGDVFVHVSPSSTPDIWFDLGDVITFLDPESEEAKKLWFAPEPDRSTDYATRIHLQLRWDADKLRPYCDGIKHLFREDVFKQKQAELKQWQEFRERTVRQALEQGKYRD